jgi:hypothetical protein
MRTKIHSRILTIAWAERFAQILPTFQIRKYHNELFLEFVWFESQFKLVIFLDLIHQKRYWHELESYQIKKYRFALAEPSKTGFTL